MADRASHRARFTRLSSSPLVQGASRLAGGAAAAQLVAIAVSPLLTRIYSPTDFGVLSVYVALSTILVNLSAARYELAIMLPDSEKDASALALVCLVLVSVTAALTSLALLTLVWAGAPGPWNDLHMWVFLVPASVLTGGFGLVFTAFAVRQGMFGLVGATTVIRQLAAAGVQVVLGAFKLAPGGLLIGAFTGFAAANLRLGAPTVGAIRSQRPQRSDLTRVIRRYSKFPKFSLPDSILNNLAVQGIPLVIGAVFGATALGFFSLAFRILALPSSVIGTAVAETFYRRITELRDTRADARRLYDRTFIGLALLSLVPFLLLGLIAPALFALVFGEEWRQSGEYARIMLPWLWVQFFSSPVSRTALAYEKNQWGLAVQGTLILCIAVPAAASIAFSWSLSEFLWALSGLSAFSYGVFLVGWRRFFNDPPPSG